MPRKFVEQKLTCPECGVVGMVKRGFVGHALIHGAVVTTAETFYGCQRYPVCLGTRNEDGDDSYSRLLRSALKRAAQRLAGPVLLIGANRAVSWLAGRCMSPGDFAQHLEEIQSSKLEVMLQKAQNFIKERRGIAIDFLALEAQIRRDRHLRKIGREAFYDMARRVPDPVIERPYMEEDLLMQAEAKLRGEVPFTGDEDSPPWKL